MTDTQWLNRIADNRRGGRGISSEVSHELEAFGSRWQGPEWFVRSVSQGVSPRGTPWWGQTVFNGVRSAA